MTWYPQRTICYASQELESANRRYDGLHKEKPYHDGTFQHWAKEPDGQHPFHFRDGVHLWVARTDVNPDDNFLTRGGGVLDGGSPGVGTP